MEWALLVVIGIGLLNPFSSSADEIQKIEASKETDGGSKPLELPDFSKVAARQRSPQLNWKKGECKRSEFVDSSKNAPEGPLYSKQSGAPDAVGCESAEVTVEIGK